MEIERRWLLPSLPARTISLPSDRITQGYASCHPDELIVFSKPKNVFELQIQIPPLGKSLETTVWNTPIPEWAFRYLSLPKNQGKVRVRDTNGTNYELTIKGEGDLAREEYNCEIPEWIARFLFVRSEDRLIFKFRTSIRDKGIKLEFDDFQQKLHGLVILECEFESLLEAEAFIVPAWVANECQGEIKEITKNKRYSNKNLASGGLP